jgi:arylsulfatase A-like enzyme
MSDSGEVSGEARGWERLRLGQLCALLGLTGFALSQPVLSVTGDSPTLFVFTDVEGWSLVGFALVVAFVPPLLLWLVVLGVGLVGRRAGDVVFSVFAVVLAGFAFVQLLRWVGVDAQVVVVVVSAAAAVGFGFLLARYENVRRWLRYTAVLPVLAVVVFVAASPTSALLRGRDAPTPAAGSDLPPVVFVMLDEFPTQSILAADGTIDRSRFPHLAALADTSTWYRNYSVMATWTDISVPAILSGQTPKQGEALWTTYPDTIFSLLAPTHDITAIESFTDLCGYDGCEGSGRTSVSGSPDVGDLTGRVLDMWSDRLTGASNETGDLGDFAETVVAGPTPDFDPEEWSSAWKAGLSSRPDSVARFLEGLEPGDPPGFHYLHLLFPHQPWTHYPSGEAYQVPSGDPRLASVDQSPWSQLVEEQRHLWQARYTDAAVGQVIDRLRQSSLYDDAVIVVTSDHGVAMEGTEQGGRNVSDEAMSSVAYVPLIVKLPGQDRAVVDDSNLMSIDLLPTVAAAVGVDVPWAIGHAAGSPEILARGDEKEIFDFGDDANSPRFERVVGFDSSARPRADLRSIPGPRDPDASPVEALARSIGLHDLLGAPVSSLGATEPSDVRVTVSDLGLLRAPPAWVPLLGVLLGQLRDDVVPGDKLVIALNGTVTTVAPVEASGRFHTLLPPTELRREGNEVQVFRLRDGLATELTLE